MPTIKWELEPNDAQLILDALQDQPYKKVTALLNKLVKQSMPPPNGAAKNETSVQLEPAPNSSGAPN